MLVIIGSRVQMILACVRFDVKRAKANEVLKTENSSVVGTFSLMLHSVLKGKDLHMIHCIIERWV